MIAGIGQRARHGIVGASLRVREGVGLLQLVAAIILGRRVIVRVLSTWAVSERARPWKLTTVSSRGRGVVRGKGIGTIRRKAPILLSTTLRLRNLLSEHVALVLIGSCDCGG